MKIQLKHSETLDNGQAVAPQAQYMLDGEVAVNMASADPRLFIKLSDDSIGNIPFIPAGSGGYLRSDTSNLSTGPIAWNGTLSTFDPPGGGTGTETSTNTAIALASGHKIAGYYDGYIRDLMQWTYGGPIIIGMSVTSFINGINLRPGNGNASVNGNYIWHAGNDGSGSGLDADTLDGISSESFLRSNQADIKTNGYLRFNDNIELQIGTGDDLTIRSNGSHTYFDVPSTSDIYFMEADTLRFQFDMGAGTLIAQGGITSYTSIAASTGMTVNSNTVWHAGNDGAASGLDADTLDGQQGSYYLDYNNFINTPSGGGGSSPWTTSGNDINYTTGKVLIGTSTVPSSGDASNARLTVSGSSASSNEAYLNIQNPSTSISGTSNNSGDTVLGNILFSGNTANWSGIGAAIYGQAHWANWSSTSHPARLRFLTTKVNSTSPSNRMEIRQNGQVFVGEDVIANSTNGAGEKLIGTGNITILNDTSSGTSTAFQVSTGSTKLLQMRVKCDGDLENRNNSYGGLSDIKLKENIVDASSQWSDIKSLQIRNFNFKAETSYNTATQIGLIAQEVELVSPGLVSETPDIDTDLNDLGTTTKSIKYSVLYMKAVKALQEAMERIEVLEQRLTDAGL